VLAKELVAA
jgi:hypothetical protein